MRKGTKVRVKLLAKLPEDQMRFRGVVGTVDLDSVSGAAVLVRFEGEQGLQQFHPGVLEICPPIKVAVAVRNKDDQPKRPNISPPKKRRSEL
jgi:hypothetical protein